MTTTKVTLSSPIDDDDDKKKEAYIPVPPAKVKQAVMRAFVTLRGLKPLLMSSDKEMHANEIASPIKLVKVRGSKVDPKAEAEKRSYRMYENGWAGPLCVPGICVQTCMENSVKFLEFQTQDRKKMRSSFSMLQKVKGSVTVEPAMIQLIHTDGSPVMDYDVNSRKVRVKATGGSVIRYRPQIDDWALRFYVEWNPHLYGVSEGVIEDLLNKAGSVGLLDDRPHYGVFDLVEFRLDDASIRMSKELESGASRRTSSIEQWKEDEHINDSKKKKKGE